MDYKFEKVKVELTLEEAREIAFTLRRSILEAVDRYWKHHISEGTTAEGFVANIAKNKKIEFQLLEGFSRMVNLELTRDVEYEIKKIYKETIKESEE